MHQESVRLMQLRATKNLGISNIEEDSHGETKPPNWMLIKQTHYLQYSKKPKAFFYDNRKPTVLND